MDPGLRHRLGLGLGLGLERARLALNRERHRNIGHRVGHRAARRAGVQVRNRAHCLIKLGGRTRVAVAARGSDGRSHRRRAAVGAIEL